MTKRISVPIQTLKNSLGKEHQDDYQDILDTLKFADLISDYKIISPETVLITIREDVDLSALLDIEETISLTGNLASNPSKQPKRYE